MKKHSDKDIADYYFNLNVTLNKTLLGGLFGVKPKADVKLIVFDPAGNKVKELKASAKAPKSVKFYDFPNKKFNKMASSHIEPFIESMLPTVNEAIASTISQF